MSVQTHDALGQLLAYPNSTSSASIDSARLSALSRPAGSESSDQVVQSLFEAFRVASNNNDRQCMDALRFAIAARQFGLRPVGEQSIEADPAAIRRRPIRALQKWRLKRVIDYIDASMSSKITSRDLAVVAGLSRMHFASQFRAATGLRPHEFLLQRRVRRAADLMRDTSMTIMEIALTVGFQTQAHFTTVFKRFTGYTPRHWRVGNHMPPRTGFEPAAAELL